MKSAVNKNKNISVLRVAAVILAVASFLLLPTCYLLAQTNTDATLNTNGSVPSPAQANTNGAVDSNTNSSSTEPAAPSATVTIPTTLPELNQELAAKQAALEELRKKADLYEKTIRVKEQETLTLQHQLSLIDLQYEQTQNSVDTVRGEMDTVNLELQAVAATIDEKVGELDYQKELLGNYLRLLYQYDQQSTLQLYVSDSSFSDFFDTIKYTEDLQSNVSGALTHVKQVKADLEVQQTTKTEKRDELAALSQKLEQSLGTMSSQKDYKTQLLSQTKDSEDKFALLLDDARREQQAAEAEMGLLEQKVRDKLQNEGVNLNTTAALMWPVSPLRGISAYFHDPGYIFRKYFEHPAVDIPTPQGTPVRAAESGYVARAKNAGLGYSYIMIVHNNQLSSVYGHISRIDVNEDDYVVRGQQIGLSGGIPGTSGAGGLTTGAHLHFEVRSGGIPVNPLDYLPSL